MAPVKGIAFTASRGRDSFIHQGSNRLFFLVGLMLYEHFNRSSLMLSIVLFDTSVGLLSYLLVEGNSQGN